MTAQLPVKLTQHQREAILHQGSPLLIIAGPGSGKTEVISWRIAHMVHSGFAAGDHILALTFTNKAVLALKDRVQIKLPEINAELMQISTFHSFCADLLRRYPEQAELPNGFQILDDVGQFLFVYSRRKNLGLDAIIKGRPSDFYRSVIGFFNHATEEQVRMEKLENWCQEHMDCCSEKDSPLWEERRCVAEAYGKYRQMLHEESLLDFPSLQSYTLKLLEEHPNVLAALQDQYHEILVDEYQDTNALQELILKQLAGYGEHLTVVGDDDQSIYRFRGATVKNILSFQDRYPNTTTIKLVDNFRSRVQIVDHSQKVIIHNPARFEKDLQPKRGPGSEVLLVYEHSASEEAQVVIQMLRALFYREKIGHWRDIAILLRSVRSYAAPYRDALTLAQIPFQVTGDASFFERDEISQLYQLINFLSASKPWGDKYLRVPLMGLGEDTCEVLKDYRDNLLDIATPQQLTALGITNEVDCKRILDMLELKQRVQKSKHTFLLEVFYDLLAITGCTKRFELAGQAEALANLGIFSQLVADWDEWGTSRNFYPFQEYLKLLREGGVDPYLPPMDDAIQVMTIHQAKGLEFPVVVLGAAMDGRLPTRRRKEHYEIPFHFCASGEPEVEDPHLVDERKLFYVAATRARDLLIAGTADVVNKRGGGPSPFLHEMFGDDLHTAAQHSLERVYGIESQDIIGRNPRPRHSFSELSMFLECPLRYKFAHVYGFEIPRLDPVPFGLNVHRALDNIHKLCIDGLIPSEEEILSIVKDTWVDSPKSLPLAEEKLKAAAVEYLRDYVRIYRTDLQRVKQSETHFSFNLRDHVMQGKIDMMRQEVDGKLEVVDFKTSKPRTEGLQRDAFQLSLYGLGVEEGLHLPVSRLTVHFLGKKQQVAQWTWNDKHKAQTRQILSQILDCIGAGKYLADHSFCPYCSEFRAICPYAN
jgi:DNA helicase-2/ATP-dependent DNA helicase PcrA